MLALAAYPLGARVTFLEPAPDAPMSSLATQICSAYDDPRALEQLARWSDVVTYEFENVPVASAQHISRFTKIFPPPDALRVSQDRLVEKTFFQSLNIPTPSFAPINSLPDLETAIARIGLPALLKTRRLGYDGKGQFLIRSQEDMTTAWHALGATNLILEQFIRFDEELAILGVRAFDGTCAFYPLVQNYHREGILRLSLAPAPSITSSLQNLAQDHARRILTALDYVGVLAIEFFRAGDNVLANEMAPRVHNSGHWTMEGAVTSQFENHVRAITGMPLGATEMRGYSAMLNFIGTLPDVNALLQLANAHIHLYDKAPRPGRKLGHVTLIATDKNKLDEQIGLVEGLFPRQAD